VIERFVENIEKAIASSIVLSSNVQKYFGPALETVYLKGHLFIYELLPEMPFLTVLMTRNSTDSKSKKSIPN